jgi:hypothetical protein
VLQFVLSLPPGSILVDIGCGNGKYFGHHKQIVEVYLYIAFYSNEVKCPVLKMY